MELRRKALSKFKQNIKCTVNNCGFKFIRLLQILCPLGYNVFNHFKTFVVLTKELFYTQLVRFTNFMEQHTSKIGKPLALSDILYIFSQKMIS